MHKRDEEERGVEYAFAIFRAGTLFIIIAALFLAVKSIQIYNDPTKLTKHAIVLHCTILHHTPPQPNTLQQTTLHYTTPQPHYPTTTQHNTCTATVTVAITVSTYPRAFSAELEGISSSYKLGRDTRIENPISLSSTSSRA